MNPLGRHSGESRNPARSNIRRGNDSNFVSNNLSGMNLENRFVDEERFLE
jgi:hypothetical protein